MILTFTNLHVHSDNSLFDGYQTIPELVSTVKSLGQASVALTDHGTMRGALDFYFECKKQNIKPILGCEFYFCEDINIQDRALTHHLVLLAKNKEGYMNLKRLDKIAYSKDDGHFYYKPRIDAKDLPKYASGVICLSACLASIVNTSDSERWVQYYKNIFGEDFYLELQPHPMKDQQEYNDKLIEYSKKYNIKLVVTTDAHYSNRMEAPWHKKWIGIKKGEYYTTNTNYLYSEYELYLERSIREDILEQAIRNTQEVDSKIEKYEIAPKGNHFPVYPVDNPKEKVREICRSSWVAKVPKDKYQQYAKRFEYELDMLEKCNYLNYLLLTWDLLNWCRKQEILIGVGRGSIGGCLVAWLMGIHHVDPIKYGLLFERFCNPEKVSSADIDNDIQTSRRKEVIDYLEQKYGEVMKIITYSRLSDKSALQRAGAVLDYNPDMVDSITKDIETIDDIKKLDLRFDPTAWIDIAKHFIGRLGAFGTHASAVLVCPMSILEFCPVEYQNVSDESLDGQNVWTQVACGDYHVLEQFKLLKEDILGLNTLDIIDQTLKQIPDRNIDIYNLPTDDDNVFQLYREGNLLGVFQCDSRGMQQVAKDMKVSNFNDIISMVALYRPAPISSGMLKQYIDGKNGATIEYPCAEIKELLQDTYGVIEYQEQVMTIAQKMAGYTMGQADVLRKIIGRKEEDKIEQATKELKSAIISHGFSEDIANYVGNQVKEAGRYIFNKSHATEYGYLSYITAYLKTYYPKEYMCSLINSKKKQSDALVYIDECKRMGIGILSPDLSKGNLKWQIEGDNLRVGLTFIRNVGKRVDVTTGSFEEITQRNDKRIMEGLIKAGALDFLNKPRGEMIASLVDTLTYLKRKNQCETKVAENKLALDGAIDEKSKRKYTRQLNSWQKKLDECELKIASRNEKYNASACECEVLGFSFSEIPRVKDGTVKKVYTKNDKRGRQMAWVTFDSAYGEFRCVCFATTWKKFKKDILVGAVCKFASGEDDILTDFQLV